MLSFPTSTQLHKRFPKEAFYKNLTLSPVVKAHFVSDIASIHIEYGFSKDNLNLAKDSDIEVIYMMQLTLKKPDYDPKMLEAIARQNPNRLVFLLTYEDQAQLVLYEKKLYCGGWIDAEALHLDARGTSLQEIWDGFVTQIALGAEAGADEELTIEQRLQRQDRIKALEKQIATLQNKVRKEKQLNKQVQMNTELKALKKELEDII